MTDVVFVNYGQQPPDAPVVSDGPTAAELLVRARLRERIERIITRRDAFLAPAILKETIDWYKPMSVTVRSSEERRGILRRLHRTDYKEERAVRCQGSVGMTTRGEFIREEVDMHERWWTTVDFIEPERGVFDPEGQFGEQREHYLTQLEHMFSSMEYAYGMS